MASKYRWEIGAKVRAKRGRFGAMRNCTVLKKVARKKGTWHRYLMRDEESGETFVAYASDIFLPVPKFNSLEEAEAWLDSHS